MSGKSEKTEWGCGEAPRFSVLRVCAFVAGGYVIPAVLGRYLVQLLVPVQVAVTGIGSYVLGASPYVLVCIVSALLMRPCFGVSLSWFIAGAHRVRVSWLVGGFFGYLILAMAVGTAALALSDTSLFAGLASAASGLAAAGVNGSGSAAVASAASTMGGSAAESTSGMGGLVVVGELLFAFVIVFFQATSEELYFRCLLIRWLFPATGEKSAAKTELHTANSACSLDSNLPTAADVCSCDFASPADRDTSVRDKNARGSSSGNPTIPAGLLPTGKAMIPAVVLTAAVFALFHVMGGLLGQSQDIAWAFVRYAGMGAFLAWLACYTGSFELSIAVHAAHNCAALLLTPDVALVWMPNTALALVGGPVLQSAALAVVLGIGVVIVWRLYEHGVFKR